MIKEAKTPKVKILVGYHKPAVLLKDDILTPIHLGRALATQASKDGEMSKEDFEWMCENMIGDDTGDNISHLNRYFCELTGIYWAWKNYDKLGNPDYIGFMHYRRHFIFDENDRTFSYIFATYDEYYNDGLYKIQLYNFLNLYDIVSTNPYCNDFINVEQYYKGKEAEKDGHIAEDYDALRCLVEDNGGIFNLFFDNYSKSHKHYAANMFIMKKDLFFNYCSLLFNIIFKLHNNIDYYGRNLQQIRSIGFISERLTGAYLFMLLQNNTKIVFVPRYDVVDNNFRQFGAINIVQSSLCYKIGKVLFNLRSKNIFLISFSLLNILFKHKKQYRIIMYIKTLKTKFVFRSLKNYDDYQEAIKIKNSDIYQFGKKILKNPFYLFYWRFK
ncbi:DUF4422 domain-containing protein [Campylobacter jejuni]|uniref:DUF4422 domain-containing protein n=2 Tax=Campylobacter jejuni TaxID=197 RepID=A0A5Y8XXL8_CAMJU|nr:DUF4422 domain-containing protein [Campylobacter jejuni]ALN43873.1 putative glycosyltransferase [Campylobacter jejuni subsp. jejuni]EAH7988403.1 DUF4422 domain-containing protein [Campylobacter jejuni]EAH9643668.1 DUF4422 domain-containing protein [Campylobacter jejuni]EAI6922713.1 DUF4422 domain-containing protein [Campylobacter jejuni]EAI8131986.1 DUF4422 domain-containing protein [Campylobacter jejuni]